MNYSFNLHVEWSELNEPQTQSAHQSCGVPANNQDVVKARFTLVQNIHAHISQIWSFNVMMYVDDLWGETEIQDLLLFYNTKDIKFSISYLIVKFNQYLSPYVS